MSGCEHPTVKCWGKSRMCGNKLSGVPPSPLDSMLPRVWDFVVYRGPIRGVKRAFIYYLTLPETTCRDTPPPNTSGAGGEP
jgi:hypothetical protein